uniref:Uncharacterized protein n=1 Tax=Arundo donax TaxID=35708 RepID=A0A0A9BYQ1_ARUDO
MMRSPAAYPNSSLQYPRRGLETSPGARASRTPR